MDFMHSEILDRYNHFQSYIHKVGDFLITIHQKKNFEIQKKGAFDLVTEADIGSEKMVIEEILKHFPRLHPWRGIG
jgi:fructose-1,6-bisphosphatase/inositol monophosphatase family enzyme